MYASLAGKGLMWRRDRSLVQYLFSAHIYCDSKRKAYSGSTVLNVVFVMKASVNTQLCRKEPTLEVEKSPVHLINRMQMCMEATRGPSTSQMKGQCPLQYLI